MHGIVLLGPPGAGKGTQAAALRDRFGLHHLSTGDALRAAVSAGTDLGAQVQGFLDRGQLVPDDVAEGVVVEELGRHLGGPGILFDGFPRTKAQAIKLDEVAARRALELLAIFLEVPAEKVVERLSARRICPSCGPRPPGEGDVCGRCGGAVHRRVDDQPDVVRRRLEVYCQQTLPVVDHYRLSGRLQRIDASGPSESVAKDLSAALERNRVRPVEGVDQRNDG